MFPQLSFVEAMDKYRIHLRFEDGTEGLIDVSNLAGKGVFCGWDIDDLFFKPFINETGGIAWNDQLDIDPYQAYLTLKGLTFDEWRQIRSLHATD